MTNQHTTMDLVKVRFKSLKFQKNQFILFGVIFGLVLLVDVALGVLLSILDWDSSLQLINNLMIILNSIFIGVYFLVNNLWLFRGEIDDNLIQNEEHYGYQTKAIFTSRLVESLFWFATFLLLLTIINLIFISGFNGFHQALFYQGYLISLGWYAVVGIIITSVTIFFASFLKVIWSSLISVLVLILIIIFAFVGQLLVDLQPTTNKYFPDVDDQYQQVYEYQQASRLIEGFKENDNLAIMKNWQSFKNIVDDPSVLDPFVYGWNSEWPEPENNDQDRVIYDFYTFFDQFFFDHANDFKKFNYDQIAGYATSAGPGEWTNLTHEPVSAVLNKMTKYDLGRYNKLIKTYAQLFKDNQSSMISQEIVPLNVRTGQWNWSSSDNSQKSGSQRSLPFGEGDLGEGNESYPYALLLWKAIENKVSPAKIMFYKLFFNNIEITTTTMDEYSEALGDNNDYNFPSIAKKMAKWAIYNPLIQLDMMFQGVNYADSLKYNYLGVANTSIGGVPMATLNGLPRFPEDDDLYPGWEGIRAHRVVGVEGLYISYLVFNGLLIFASYWIFKKRIKQ